MATGTVQLYQDRAGEWRWRLRAANNEIVADSAEGYTTQDGCVQAWYRVHELVCGGGLSWG